jgi:hypothetical protein
MNTKIPKKIDDVKLVAISVSSIFSFCVIAGPNPMSLNMSAKLSMIKTILISPKSTGDKSLDKTASTTN